MDENCIDLILTGIPKGSGSERFRREAAKIIIQEKYERHEKIYTDGSKKDERAGSPRTPNRTYRRRVHQQSTVLSTE
jgi:hypothetical protein